MEESILRVFNELSVSVAVCSEDERHCEIVVLGHCLLCCRQQLVGIVSVLDVECFHDTRFQSNDATGTFDDVHKILERFLVHHGEKHVPSLVEHVELLLRLVHGVGKINLTLEVEGYFLNDLQELHTVGSLGDFSVFLRCFDLLLHHVRTLPPYE